MNAQMKSQHPADFSLLIDGRLIDGAALLGHR
jgi:hypothetical protein